jgi:hypothetical protein
MKSTSVSKMNAPAGYALLDYERFEKITELVGNIKGISNKETKQELLNILEKIDLESNF